MQKDTGNSSFLEDDSIHSGDEGQNKKHPEKIDRKKSNPKKEKKLNTEKPKETKEKTGKTANKAESNYAAEYLKLVPPKISVPLYNLQEVSSKQVATYKVVINDPNKAGVQEYEIQKRFRDFYQLWRNLCRNAGDIPEFPNRTLFKVSKPEALEKRRKILESWLQEVVRKYELWGCKELVEFLQVSCDPRC